MAPGRASPVAVPIGVPLATKASCAAARPPSPRTRRSGGPAGRLRRWLHASHGLMAPPLVAAAVVDLALLVVEAPDRAGTLARIARALAKANINVQGFTVGPGGIKLVTQQGDLAAKTIRALGAKCGVTYVQEVQIPDRPGALAELCERLAGAGVSLTDAFGVGTGFAGRIYLNVSDFSRAGPILAAYGASPAGNPTLGRAGTPVQP
jgi:hypothetical protein